MPGIRVNSFGLFASVLMACLWAVGVASMTNAASAGQSSLKAGKSATNYVFDSRCLIRDPRIHLPIAPSYIYYDYPYYYCRGHYPTHIRGFIYRAFISSDDSERGGRHRKCVTKGSGARKCL
jgi:hypothetical protein